ncbi:MAG: alpha/beta hydrolase [Clostridia bacterium]|nr:alpha/beta hydrolase [Clostridia bacterium]
MSKTALTKLTFADGQPFANSRYFASGDYHLHYRVDPAKGTEKAKMFMVHGFGCNTTFFDELVELYTAAGIRCVRADLPDFGFSTREWKGMKFVPQVQLLFELMDALDTDKSGWILLGHSMGGSVALELANEDDSRFNAIILNAPLLMFNVPPWLSKLIMIKPLRVVMDKALA